MKSLYLLRHAKSSWHDPALNDYDRPLNPRGLRNAPLIGRHMAGAGLVPAVILCSSSRRTLETLSLVKPLLGLTIPTRIDDSLYLASARLLLATVNEIDEVHDSALVIAHNPGLEDCARLLGRPGEDPGFAPDGLPTAGLVVIQFPVDRWEDVAEGQGRIVGFVTPKTLDPTAAEN